MQVFHQRLDGGVRHFYQLFSLVRVLILVEVTAVTALGRLLTKPPHVFPNLLLRRKHHLLVGSDADVVVAVKPLVLFEQAKLFDFRRS